MRKRLAALAIVTGIIVPVIGSPQFAHAEDVGTHVFWLQGISTIQQQFTYVPASPRVLDEAAPGAGTPGILKPSTLPPTLTKTTCSLARNTNPAVPVTACAGILTHATLPGPQGCTESTNPTAACSFSGGSTWYYGYCGQTYGGVKDVQFQFGGQTWRIDRAGFPRLRGVGEFNGKMTRLSPAPQIQAKLRMYISAVPNNPDEAAGCELTHNLSSIYFQGVAIVYGGDALPRAISPAPGWHWCDGTDGC